MSNNESGTVRGIFVGFTLGFVAGAVTALLKNRYKKNSQWSGWKSWREGRQD